MLFHGFPCHAPLSSVPPVVENSVTVLVKLSHRTSYLGTALDIIDYANSNRAGGIKLVKQLGCETIGTVWTAWTPEGVFP